MNERWTNALLDGARTQGDPLADDCAQSLSDPELTTITRFLSIRWRNGDPVPRGLPGPFAHFVGRSTDLPPWADDAKLQRAQRFFTRCPGDLLAMLLYAALPECFAAAQGASVLTASDRMISGIRLRLFDTASFVVDVMSPGAMAPSGRGIRSIQRTRWAHSLTRRRLMRNGRSSEALPINQEEMAGTNLAFSVIAVDALAKLGALPGDADRDAYLHAWNVVAFLLGVQEKYLAHSYEEACLALELLRNRNQRASIHGKRLTAALVGFARSRFPPPFRGFPGLLIAHLVPENTARALGLSLERDPCASALLLLVRMGFRARGRALAISDRVKLIDLPNSLPVLRVLLSFERHLATRSARLLEDAIDGS